MTTSMTVTEEEASQLQAMGFRYVDYSSAAHEVIGYWRRMCNSGHSSLDIDYNIGSLSDHRFDHRFLAYYNSGFGRQKTGFDNIISAATWLLLQGEQL